MSSIDPEVLYLILTKTSARETFYGFDAANPSPGQSPGTITARQLAGVYERITGNRVGTRLNWGPPVSQLNALLAQCGLPALGSVLVVEGAEGAANPGGVQVLASVLERVHAQKWPAFSALKSLYGRKK